MNPTADVIAIDLGATSGRLIAGCWNGRTLSTEELHRFPNYGVSVANSLRWDVLRIWTEIQEGLRSYGTKFRRSPQSIGIDTWGVDFGLLDRQGQLIANPYHYRDCRTGDATRRLAEIVGVSDLFSRTGVQPSPINTLVQLYSMMLRSDDTLKIAARLLLMPDLIQYFLTGFIGSEVSIASTTQMLKPESGTWDQDLMRAIGILPDILPVLNPQASIVSSVLPNILEGCGLGAPFPVIAVASHDTASAIAAIPDLDCRSLFLCCGTWSLMGIEHTSAITSDEALELGFTNELGAFGSMLVMKNLTGLWIVQECLRIWSERGLLYHWEDLIAAAETSAPLQSFIDPNHPQFASPGDMPESIRGYCEATNQTVPQTMGELIRCCFESLCLSYRLTLDHIERLTGKRIEVVRVVGGGSRNEFLCRMISNACDRCTISGPAEASALGNALLQLMAIGEISDLREGRQIIAQSYPQKTVLPDDSAAWQEAYGRFCRITKMETAAIA